MFLKNKNIIFKIRRSKVTDYAALNKECPKLLCGLGIGHRRRQTIPMWNSSGEKRNSSGHHCMSGVCGIEHYVMTW